jgi:hypothetical protein
MGYYFSKTRSNGMSVLLALAIPGRGVSSFVDSTSDCAPIERCRETLMNASFSKN